MKRLFFVAMAVGLAGCSGHVVTMDRAAACKTNESSGGTVCKGVPYRMSVPKLTEVTLVRTVDAEGKTILSASEKDSAKQCTPMKAVTIKAKASSTVSYISYDPGFLEYADFDVELSADGTISKVGTASASGVKDTADAISTLAGAYLAFKTAGTAGFMGSNESVKYCNAEAEDAFR